VHLQLVALVPLALPVSPLAAPSFVVYAIPCLAPIIVLASCLHPFAVGMLFERALSEGIGRANTPGFFEPEVLADAVSVLPEPGRRFGLLHRIPLGDGFVQHRRLVRRVAPSLGPGLRLSACRALAVPTPWWRLWTSPARATVCMLPSTLTVHARF
jgi:hypothetical protein